VTRNAYIPGDVYEVMVNMPRKKKKIKVMIECCCDCHAQEHLWWMEDGLFFEIWVCYELDDPRILHRISDAADIHDLADCCPIPEWCPRRKVKK
jgi:hypothetical protein